MRPEVGDAAHAERLSEGFGLPEGEPRGCRPDFDRRAIYERRRYTKSTSPRPSQAQDSHVTVRPGLACLIGTRDAIPRETADDATAITTFKPDYHHGS